MDAGEMSDTRSSLEQARLEAAVRSGGTSSGVIHNTALAQALRAQPDPRDVLDFGSGVGGFLPDLAAAFPNARLFGVDIMARPVGLDASVGWEEADLNQATPFPDQSFDLIFTVEVIEHLENPRHVMRELHRLLRPGGVLILTTPNPTSVRSVVQMALRGHFALFDDANYPAHIMAVTPVELRRIASEVGYKELRLFFTDRGHIPKFLRWTWQEVPLLGPLMKGARFSDNYGAVLRKAAE